MDARYFEGKTGKVARFSIAHNFAHGQQPLFVDCVMFSKTGAKDTPIPENLLTKGTPVQICGLFRPAKTAEGKYSAYSREELVAEIGNAMICNRLGIEHEKAFKNSAAYIQSWLKALKNDNRMIVWAAKKAEEAARYILGESLPEG